MEQARVLIAIVLSFLVFFLWNFFFGAKKTTVVPAEKEISETAAPSAETQAPQNASPAVDHTEAEKIDTNVIPVQSGPIAESDVKKISIDTPFYKISIDEKGAVVDSYILKEYREGATAGSPQKQLIEDELKNDILRVSLQENSIPELDRAVFSCNEKTETIAVTGQPKEIVFSWVSPANVVVEKRYRFDPQTYLVGLTIVLKNGSTEAINDSLVVELAGSNGSASRGYAFEGPSGLVDDKLQQIKPKKIKGAKELSGRITWVAIETRYFMKSLVPSQPVNAVMRLQESDNNIVKNQLVMPKESLAPGLQKIYAYDVFFGPKSMRVLSHMGHQLKRAVHFGMFDFIAKPCLWFMNFIYGIIPNYGIAIIILTVLTKLILWPLGSKSYKSMNAMKRLQPLMAEIREKYKNDKKLMNQELMGLYKTYKINPMGGCLPMVLQIPVFFALYRMLYSAIELRHAPFFLWINDLSAPDRLFRFDFSIPFMQPPYGIPVLTLVMGATMLLQQKMSPPPGDPTQAKMMMFMPIIFTVIFINFSSGLVLYWLVNNILSIAQQYYIQKKHA